MIYVILGLLGLFLGSFVNALVWRVHEQEKPSKSRKKAQELSIAKGRSMCPHCRHKLQARDLVPVLSWLALGGKCRYCQKPIGWQYPVVEGATSLLFIASYMWWPRAFEGTEIAIFAVWLAVLVGLIALSVYDLKWYLLPDRIMRPLYVLAGVMAVLTISQDNKPLKASLLTGVAVLIGGGIFYVIFQVSKGEWIGGGDVKLGWLLGLIVATPAKSLLCIFIAAVAGTVVALPMLASKRLKRESIIPFGPFLILGAYIAVLFGTQILDWYQRTFIKI